MLLNLQSVTSIPLINDCVYYVAVSGRYVHAAQCKQLAPTCYVANVNMSDSSVVFTGNSQPLLLSKTIVRARDN